MKIYFPIKKASLQVLLDFFYFFDLNRPYLVIYAL
jgi:hypothetical protein